MKVEAYKHAGCRTDGCGQRASVARSCCTFGQDGEYEISVACSMDELHEAWALVYELYREKNYAEPNDQGLWYSLYDALPETTTFLVRRCGHAVATVTLIFDSPLGLPADELYGRELDTLRAEGRRLCEIVSLVNGEGSRGRCLETLKHMFRLGWLRARHLEDATDFVITVHPHHAGYYLKRLLFTQTGNAKSYEKVGGAPAVLLRSDLETVESRYYRKYGMSQRSLYRFFFGNPDRQDLWRAYLETNRKSMSEYEMQEWFERKRPFLQQAPAVARDYVRSRHRVDRFHGRLAPAVAGGHPGIGVEAWLV